MKGVGRSGERRREPRTQCADLIELTWCSESGPHRTYANLEDISRSGACLQIDQPVTIDAIVRIACDSAAVSGRVRFCLFRDTGYFLGVQFEPGCEWHWRRFRPRHLLDPRRLPLATRPVLDGAGRER